MVRLITEEAIPAAMTLCCLKLVTNRALDITCTVRKQAVNALTIFIKNQPYGDTVQVPLLSDLLLHQEKSACVVLWQISMWCDVVGMRATLYSDIFSASGHYLYLYCSVTHQKPHTSNYCCSCACQRLQMNWRERKLRIGPWEGYWRKRRSKWWGQLREYVFW